MVITDKQMQKPTSYCSVNIDETVKDFRNVVSSGVKRHLTFVFSILKNGLLVTRM